MEPICVGHRGASAHKKGNTLESFEEAIRLGAHMVELDVQLCGSGEVVVFHDVHLDNGMFIGDLTLEQVRNYAPYVPTIDQVLDTINKRIAIYFDLKDEACIPELMKILEHRCSTDNWDASTFLVASFNHYQLIAVNSYRGAGSVLEHMQTVALTSSIPLGHTKSYEQIDIGYVAIDYSILTLEFVADAHKRGLKVLVWTVNQLPSMKKMLEMKVDGLISDYPERVIEAIGSVRFNGITTGESCTSEETMYKAGQAVDFFCDGEWHPGVVLALSKEAADEVTYSLLWWIDDNSQQRKTNVKPLDLRPSPSRHIS